MISRMNVMQDERSANIPYTIAFADLQEIRRWLPGFQRIPTWRKSSGVFMGPDAYMHGCTEREVTRMS